MPSASSVVTAIICFLKGRGGILTSELSNNESLQTETRNENENCSNIQNKATAFFISHCRLLFVILFFILAQVGPLPECSGRATTLQHVIHGSLYAFRFFFTSL